MLRNPSKSRVPLGASLRIFKANMSKLIQSPGNNGHNRHAENNSENETMRTRRPIRLNRTKTTILHTLTI